MASRPQRSFSIRFVPRAKRCRFEEHNRPEVRPPGGFFHFFSFIEVSYKSSHRTLSVVVSKNVAARRIVHRVVFFSFFLFCDVNYISSHRTLSVVVSKNVTARRFVHRVVFSFFLFCDVSYKSSHRALSVAVLKIITAWRIVHRVVFCLHSRMKHHRKRKHFPTSLHTNWNSFIFQ